MLIMPSFKKSLIEQFQGNYLKEVTARLQMGPAKYGTKFVWLNRTALNYTVQHGDLACLSRVYYPGHNYPKRPRDSQIRAEPSTIVLYNVTQVDLGKM